MSDNFIKGTAWASGANIFFLATGYLAQILIGRSLSPADFGTFGVIIFLLNLIEYVFTNGISQSLSKFTAEHPQSARSVIRHSVVAQIFMVFVISLPLWLLAPQVAGAFGDINMAPLLKIVALILPFYGIRSLLQGILGGQRQFTAQAKVKSIIALLKFALIGLALLLNVGVATILYAYLLSSLIGAIFGWHFVKPAERAAVVPAGIFYRYALSLTIFLVIFPLFINIDVFLVKRLVASANDVGLYVAATTLARMPFYLFTGLLLTLLPSVAHLKQTEPIKLRRVVREINRYALIFLIPMAVFVVITADSLLPLIFGAKYHGGGDALSVLIIGVSLLVLFRIFSTVLVGITSPRQVTITTSLIIIIDIVLNLVLIPRWGIIGAAAASAISSIFGLLAATIQLRRYQLALIDLISLKKAATASAIVGLLIFFHPTNWLLIPVILAALALYVGLLAVFREIQTRDINRLCYLLGRRQSVPESTDDQP
ncbi:MAG: oligosaccharide flippase family protein [Patescibacteria group bacterium]